ncbi:hypothetical protein [Billgrantia montanilacus]|uniref:Uncharacterized protein n=1 Tax=Billgrantia montanilacus TaxID=2282305 RepID=A0A368U1T9_9GAMM|nr:hypothetical protein [Halomonas montanilacus]RCV90516.1 hypothetical protein DU505_06155 [Halomonas montanilacus]
MQQFLFPRRPLSRGTLIFCHLLLQLGLLTAAALWLMPRTPVLASTDWVTAWPALAVGGGLWLLGAMILRLLVELCLLPHHLNGRPGFAPRDVMTRSFERRPAVHADDAAWTSEARHLETEASVLGSARITRPADPLKPTRTSS